VIAILNLADQQPSLKRSTITGMLSAGAGLSAAGMGRAGYGFDYLADLGGGQFYGQKGGSLASSGNVLELNGEWGFAMQWAASERRDEAGIRTIRRDEHRQSRGVGGAGSVPQFGMPSL